MLKQSGLFACSLQAELILSGGCYQYLTISNPLTNELVEAEQMLLMVELDNIFSRSAAVLSFNHQLRNDIVN
ncbi:hypothetical protein D918_03483 [Trichuris suis]|nr:hypothetical protein D918_03483 [Trichuris suis]